jgi:CheY-like chemotaxis protein
MLTRSVLNNGGCQGTRVMSCILIVEDDMDIREALEQILEGEGYQVVSAPNGKVALDRMREFKPQLVLLDLMMPVMNGWQFRQNQRQDDALAHVPVVIISADGSARREATAMGVQGFMQKPIELEDLLGVVATHVPTP